MKSLVKCVLVSALLGVFWLWSSPVVYAQARQVYTGTIGLTQTDWAGSMSFPRFDPARGILTGVEFALAGHLQGQAEFERLDAQAAVVAVGMSANVQLQRPNGEQILQAVPETTVAAPLGPFDHEIDYAGSSGHAFPSLIGIDIAESDIFTDSVDLRLFSGEGEISLPVAATGRAAGQGGGNLALNYVNQGSALVTVTYLYENATIDLEKYTNGDDADLAPGVLLQVGQPVTWTYRITNTGLADLLELTVFDDQEGAITCPSTSLAAGATMICTLVGQAGAQPHQYTNVATVTAKTEDDGVNIRRTVTDSDPSNYFASKIPICPVDNQGRVILPNLLFLGAGAGTYVLPDGYDTFIIKRRATMGIPFRFDTDPGTRNSRGQQVVVIPSGLEGSRQRVWACAGDCNFVAHLDGPVDIGYLPAGVTIGAVIIDDDNDVRINKWQAEVNRVVTEYPILGQTMVEYLTLTIPLSANWSYFAVDSVGIVDLCLVPPHASFVASAANGGSAAANEDRTAPPIFFPTLFCSR